jgi:hypothetical protein
MGKILNALKKYSFGGYKTGLYRNNAITFGSLLSVIVSALFLIGFLTALSIYFNEIFIQQHDHIDLFEIKLFNKTELSQFYIPEAIRSIPNFTLSIAISIT